MLRDVLPQAAIAAVMIAFVFAADLLTPEEARLIDSKTLLMTEKELTDSRVTMRRTKTSPHSYVLVSIESHCADPTKDACPYRKFTLAASYDVTRNDKNFLVKAMGYGYQADRKAKTAGKFDHVKGAVTKGSPQDQFILNIKAILDGFVKKIYKAAGISNSELAWNSDGDVGVEMAFKSAAVGNPRVRTEGGMTSKNAVAASPGVWTEGDDVAYSDDVRNSLKSDEEDAIIHHMVAIPETLGLGDKITYDSQISVRKTRSLPNSNVLCSIEAYCEPINDACPFRYFEFAAAFDVKKLDKARTVTAQNYNFIASKIMNDYSINADSISGADKQKPEGAFIWMVKEKLDKHIKELFNAAEIVNSGRAWHSRHAAEVVDAFTKANEDAQIPVAKAKWSKDIVYVNMY